MLTYVIRRLLYSVVVLIAASFIVFTFVSVSGDPLAAPEMQPEHLAADDPEHRGAQAPRRPDPRCATSTGCKDAVTNQFGTTLLGDQPILPDLWRVMRHTLQLVIIAELLAILIAVVIGVYSALRQYSRLRLHARRRSASSASRCPSSGSR